MANVTGSRGEFIDLGNFKSIECHGVGDNPYSVCKIEFQQGDIVIKDKILETICSKRTFGEAYL